MEFLLVLLSLLLIIFYLTLGIYISSGLGKSRENSSEKPLSLKTTVIVAVRNEEKNIPELLECLQKQRFADLKVIIVDDYSTDSTVNTIRQLSVEDANISVLQAGDNVNKWGPKKNALHGGILAADAEIILTTDADCRPGPDWAMRMVNMFGDDTAAVIGYSPLRSGNDLPGRLKSLEAQASAIVAAGLAGRGTPYMATGRNLSYRKQNYLEIGGFGEKGKLPAGDDDLLVQELAKTGRVKFASHPDSFVPSVVEKGDYIARKKRHFAVARSFPASFIALGVGVFLYILASTAEIVYGIAARENAILFSGIMMLAVKILTDLIIFNMGSKILHERYRFLDFLAAELFQIPYTLILEPVSFFGKVKWRGRSL